MPQIKAIQELTQTADNVVAGFNGDAVSLDGALTYSAQCVVDVNTPTAKTFDNGAANASDIATVADVGVKEVSDVTCVADTGVKEVSTVTTGADVAGSLNDTYFLFSAMNSGGASEQNFYVWYNINSAGSDPLVADATGVEVTAATGATASAIATATRSAITSVAGAKVVVSGATDQVVITGKFMGAATDIADGAAPTGFGLVTTTQGVASNLNSTYFNYQTENLGGASQNNRYVWYNVNSEGTDPAPAGRTGIAVALSASATDSTVASSTRTALAADNKVAITGSTTHVIITNVYMGNVVNAANGTASPGFSYSITPGVASNLNNKYITFSQTHNAVNYYAWYNVNSEGTDPALSGKTGIAVTLSASATADTVASSSRTAIDTAIGPEIVVTGSTNHIILTNSTRGTCAATANGAASPSFTISNSPAGANPEVDPDNEEITIPSHGLTTGLKGQLTSTGTLPTGLSTGTDYYVIVIDENTIQFANSYQNAVDGVPVTFSDYGSDAGVDTFTSTAIGSASVKLQMSNDGVNWSDEGSSVNITQDANLMLKKVNPEGAWMRLVFDISAGRFSTSNLILVKGPN